VFGKVAGVEAAKYARSAGPTNGVSLRWQEQDTSGKALAILNRPAGGEKVAKVREEMALSMERGCGIYRIGTEVEETCAKLAELQDRIARVSLQDRAPGWNTEWLSTIELGFQLDVAQAIAHSALERRESRGAHQRLDSYTERDDAKYLKHTLASHAGGAAPRITYSDVVITQSRPGTRAYGAAGEDAERLEQATDA
jgi:fumarate reductase flavoprotein subunit